ncbi:ATPase AAA-type core [Penicillium chrysogenum]|uniref:ATPase AAA-type core n=1 Tax=Penicillium chrysogenum TaxID=5076 RepID=A0ABQ8WXM2_PENCH|nr:ATPase AAA-type core [Penicillium chrysogenum]
MGSNSGKFTKLPLVSLAKGSVLRPALVDRSKRDGNSITFGSIPLGSPFLSRDGQQILEGEDSDEERKEDCDSIDAGQARKDDLFRHGTVGKVIGVQRHAYAELFLLVQGSQCFIVKKVLKERPYFEAEVFVHGEDNSSMQAPDSIAPVVAFVGGLNSSLATSGKEVRIYISKTDLAQAGKLADFMADVSVASFEEKLRILASFNVKERLERVVGILSRQAQHIKSKRELLARRAIQGLPGLSPPGPGSRGGDDEKEPNERLRKMNPANAEYGVCRTYLENLAEIPWSKVTADQLGPETLKRARQQLGEDH